MRLKKRILNRAAHGEAFRVLVNFRGNFSIMVTKSLYKKSLMRADCNTCFHYHMSPAYVVNITTFHQHMLTVPAHSTSISCNYRHMSSTYVVIKIKFGHGISLLMYVTIIWCHNHLSVTTCHQRITLPMLFSSAYHQILLIYFANHKVIHPTSTFTLLCFH